MTKPRKHDMPDFAYIITCGGEFDQVCETRRDAIAALNDLQEMSAEKPRAVVVAWLRQDACIDAMDAGDRFSQDQRERGEQYWFSVEKRHRARGFIAA